MKAVQGIQMIGTQRSGSNLLRVILDEIDGITAPHPPHILQRFLPLLPKYGNLSIPSHFCRLAEDVCSLVRFNPVPWEGVVIDTCQIIQSCKVPTLYELFRVIYETAAIQHQDSFWLCKSMKNVYYATEMECAGLHPYYIYLYRDGRDVALSFQKAVVGEKHIYALARNWMKDQEEALRLQEYIPAERFFSLSYENLVTDPVGMTRKLCRFLGVNYSDRAMEYYKSRESLNTAMAGKMWSNVTKPIMKNNIFKFLHELSPENTIIFESVAGEMLKKLGYPLYVPAASLRSFTEEEIVQFMEENERLKQAFNQTVDSEDLEKRRPQAELLEKIKRTYL